MIENIDSISGGYDDDLGTFSGRLYTEELSEITLENNYVLNVLGYDQVAFNTGGSGNISGVTTLANASDFADEANLTGLDFENIWNMSEELQHPIHKSYSLGLINLSSDSFSTSFSLTAEDRLYNEDEQIECEVDLINAEHQIIVFDINGEDKLSTLQTGKITLPAGKNYAIVIKAGNKYELTLPKQEGAEISFAQGTTFTENSDSYTVKFKMGDSITFNLVAKEGYTITEPTLSGLTLTKNADGSYTINAPKTKNFNENQSYALTYTANLDNTKGGGDNDNNNLPIIIGCSVGGVILLAGVITLIIVKKKKKSQ